MRPERRRLSSLLRGWRERASKRRTEEGLGARSERVACPHCRGGTADWPVGLWTDGGPLLCVRCGGVTDRRGRPFVVAVERLVSRREAAPARPVQPPDRLADVWGALTAQLAQRQPLAASHELAGYLRLVSSRLGVATVPEVRFVDLGEPLISAVSRDGLLVSLGLLAQLEDEAQLAFALARESALVEAGVVPRRFAAARARATAGSRLGRARRLGERALEALEVSWRLGYGLDWEREADHRAAVAIRLAGYDGDAPRRTLALLESASLAGRGGRFLLAAERASQLPGPTIPRGRLNQEVYRRAVGGFRVFLRGG
jgi:hypothetical protein